jgi:serine protease Do
MRGVVAGAAALLLGCGFACDSSDEGVLQTHEGRLEAGDSFREGSTALYDRYPVEVKRGDRLEIDMTSNEIDSYLQVFDDDGQLLADHDDIHSRRRDATIELEAPRDGTLDIYASTPEEREEGPYTLRVRVIAASD